MNSRNFRVFVFLIPLLFNSSVYVHADLTANLELRAEVDTEMEISVSAEPTAQNLPAENKTNAEGLLIGIAAERSNSENGYTVTIVSDNQSKLVSPETTYSIAYTINYGTIEVDLSTGSALVVDTNAIPSSGEVTREIRITYTIDELPPNIYTDTLTFIMAAK